MKAVDKLSTEKIRSLVKDNLVGSQVLVFGRTSSTNDIAWRCMTAGGNGLCVFAECQTSGRGRRGRKWFCPSHQGILCSVVLTGWEKGAELLTLSAAVAITEVVDKFCPTGSKIKWPNDILVDSKKVAGILVESRKRNNIHGYIIGIGINCHQNPRHFEKLDLLAPATSIDIEKGSVVDRNAVAAGLLNSLEKWFALAGKDAEAVLDCWQRKNCVLGRHIQLESDNKTYSGNCVGLDPFRGLILQLDGGPVKIFSAATTTIVKYSG